MMSQIDLWPAYGCSVFYLSHGLVRVSDLVCENDLHLRDAAKNFKNLTSSKELGNKTGISCRFVV